MCWCLNSWHFELQGSCFPILPCLFLLKCVNVVRQVAHVSQWVWSSNLLLRYWQTEDVYLSLAICNQRACGSVLAVTVNELGYYDAHSPSKQQKSPQYTVLIGSLMLTRAGLDSLLTQLYSTLTEQLLSDFPKWRHWSFPLWGVSAGTRTITSLWPPPHRSGGHLTRGNQKVKQNVFF